jgi:hypothetical protein
MEQVAQPVGATGLVADQFALLRDPGRGRTRERAAQKPLQGHPAVSLCSWRIGATTRRSAVHRKYDRATWSDRSARL